jgi:DNA primase
MTTAPAQPDRIDLASVARAADLVSVLTAYLGPPGGRAGQPRWRCPWHDDASPSLYLWAKAGALRWRCWPCGLSGDALDFVARFESVDVVEAARRLSPDAIRPPGRRRGPGGGPPPPRPDESASAPGVPAETPWRSPEWQAAADDLIRGAEARLWSPAGRDALGWLRRRGLADHAIRRARLGFSPEWHSTGPLDALADRDGPRPIKVARGVVIPWPAPGEFEAPRWAGANVRQLMRDVWEPLPKEKSKYLAFTDSARGHAYPFADLLPTQGSLPALLVEGEFDALLAHQEAGHVAHAITVGGATQGPHPSALAFLARCPWILVATDHDAAGAESASAWLARLPHKARRAILPAGKDLTEFVISGGDARAWLAAELARLGIGARPNNRSKGDG